MLGLSVIILFKSVLHVFCYLVFSAHNTCDRISQFQPNFTISSKPTWNILNTRNTWNTWNTLELGQFRTVCDVFIWEGGGAYLILYCVYMVEITNFHLPHLLVGWIE